MDQNDETDLSLTCDANSDTQELTTTMELQSLFDEEPYTPPTTHPIRPITPPDHTSYLQRFHITTLRTEIWHIQLIILSYIVGEDLWLEMVEFMMDFGYEMDEMSDYDD